MLCRAWYLEDISDLPVAQFPIDDSKDRAKNSVGARRSISSVFLNSIVYIIPCYGSFSKSTIAWSRYYVSLPKLMFCINSNRYCTKISYYVRVEYFKSSIISNLSMWRDFKLLSFVYKLVLNLSFIFWFQVDDRVRSPGTSRCLTTTMSLSISPSSPEEPVTL